LLAGVLAGCQHSEPFSTSSFSPTGPFSRAIPRILTLNVATDLFPVWKPDETGLFYSYERTDDQDRDRCIAQMPPSGRTRSLTICTHASFSADSIDALEMPVVSDTRIVYLSSVGEAGALTPFHRELFLSSLDNLIPVDTLLRFSFVAPSGRTHDIPTHMAWLGDDALIYVGARVDYVPPAPFAPPDTLVTGVEIARIDLSGPTPQVGIIPGTSLASSVQPSADAKSIYFTVAGSSVVYKQDLATATASVVHDFGGLGIARDVQVAGNTLVAVVGGFVTFANDPTLGPVTRDFGGFLYSVDLVSSQETDISLPGYVHRRPALSPSGQKLVVEAYQVVGAPGLPLRNADLWLLEEP
jgi:hypothetical protein